MSDVQLLFQALFTGSYCTNCHFYKHLFIYLNSLCNPYIFTNCLTFNQCTLAGTSAVTDIIFCNMVFDYIFQYIDQPTQMLNLILSDIINCSTRLCGRKLTDYCPKIFEGEVHWQVGCFQDKNVGRFLIKPPNLPKCKVLQPKICAIQY